MSGGFRGGISGKCLTVHVGTRIHSGWLWMGPLSGLEWVDPPSPRRVDPGPHVVSEESRR